MNRAMGIRACIVLLVFTGSANAMSARSVEVPIGQAGDVQVAEIVARLARASGVPIDRPPAGLTLSTQGLSRALTRALLAEALGPEVEITFRPGAMVLNIDDRILAPGRRPSGSSGCATWPTARRRPPGAARTTGCGPSPPTGPMTRPGRRSALSMA